MKTLFGMVTLSIIMSVGCGESSQSPPDAGVNSNARCDDGEQNGDETGVDCGGSCAACVTHTCDDGEQNGDEIGVDCGGSCPEQDCCSNGHLDSALGETDVDCGGSCGHCRECGPSRPCDGSLECCGGQCVSGLCYYVSAGGDDENDGTSESSPWRSLERVNAFVASPGDAILFKRGDAWVGTLSVGASGTVDASILYGAYGDGELPRIYGSEEVTGWTLHSGSIYKATLPRPVTQLFVDGQRAQLARYPNAGYLHITSVQGTTQFASDELTSQGEDFYKDAKVYVKTNEWRLDTRDVIASSGQSLTIDSDLSYAMRTGLGFFLSNKIGFLDQAGQWFYDAATSTVYLWTSTGDSPANHEVRGSVAADGVFLDATSHVTLRDVSILQHQERGVAIEGGSNVTIERCEISGAELYGIQVSDSMGSNTLSGNVVRGANHIALSCGGGGNVVADNQLLDTALFPQLGIRGMDGFSYVMSVGGDDNVIQYNHVVNAGFCGIVWGGQNALISSNIVEGVCSVLTDGGAFYTFSSNIDSHFVAGSVLSHNIVRFQEHGAAIYMDERTRDVIIEDNTVANCSAMGIFCHDTMDIELRRNTVFDIPRALRVTGTYGGNFAHHNTICNVESTVDHGGGIESPAKLILMDPGEGTLTLDNNTYVDHHRTRVYMRTDSYSYLTFSEWQSVTGQDANSSAYHDALGAGEQEELLLNDTKDSKEFFLAGSYRDVAGAPVTSPVTLEPFSSMILIRQ